MTEISCIAKRVRIAGGNCRLTQRQAREKLSFSLTYTSFLQKNFSLKYLLFPPPQKSIKRAKKKKKGKEQDGEEEEKISLFPVMARTFWWNYFLGTTLKVAADVLALASPQVMSLMIDYATMYAYSQEDPSIEPEPEWHGYFYAVVMLVCISGYSVLNASAQAQVL